MRGRKKTSETRLAIVRCASEVFSQREFHEVLTDDIAQRLRETVRHHLEMEEVTWSIAFEKKFEDRPAGI